MQKKKRENRKVDLNDSPEIPNRGETSDIPDLASGRFTVRDTRHAAFHVSKDN